MKISYITILILFTVVSCKQDRLNKDATSLPGRIIYRYVDWTRMNERGSCCYSEYHLYSKGEDKKISIFPDNHEQIDIMKFLNNEFALIGLKDSKHIIKIDTSGHILSTIFEVNDSFRVWNMFPSPNDKYILIIKQPRIHNNIDPCAQEHAPYIFSILDTVSKIEITLLRFNNEEFVTLSDNPWSPDNQQFVFTYNQDSRCILLDPSAKSTPEPDNTLKFNGVYKYNIQNDNIELLIKSANHAIWSNSGKYIGFVIKEDIGVLDLNSHEMRIIRHARSHETVKTIHWLPYIDVLYSCHRFSFIHLDIITLFSKTRYSAYDLNNKKQTNYQFFDFGFDYTWK